MKIVFVCLLFVSLFHASEIQRIESIVDDISKLRVDYEKCQKRLSGKGNVKPDLVEHKKSLKESRQKNIILKAEVDYLSEASSNHSKSIEKYKKLLKIKDKEIKDLKKKLEKFKNSNRKTKKTLQICKIKTDDNPFPKLMPKAGITPVKSKKITQKAKVKVEKQEKITSLKASVFRLKKSSSIYSSPNSKKLYTWDKDRTFTSNIGTKNWIKITGYFVNKKWKQSKNELWIKRSDVKKRK